VRRRAPGLLLAALILAAAAGFAAEIRLRSGADPGAPPVERLDGVDDVANPVLSCLARLIDDDLYGWVGQDRLRRAVEEGGDRRLPWQRFLWVRREPASRRGAWVTVRFLDRLHEAVPYALLGYHPGSLQATSKVVLRQWPPGPAAAGYRDEDGTTAVLRVEDLVLFAVTEGEVLVDVDGWIDALMGGRLDDIRITGMALFRHEGRRLGLAFGYNPDGEGRTGVLDLGRDELLFPVPRPYLALGRALRSRAELLLARERNP
jgi:hypothetical protein